MKGITAGISYPGKVPCPIKGERQEIEAALYCMYAKWGAQILGAHTDGNRSSCPLTRGLERTSDPRRPHGQKECSESVLL